LALAGVVVLVRREPAFAALFASVALPPLAFVLLRTDSAPDLSPRHLFYALPLWAAAIGVAAARLPLVATALVALIAVTSPASALRDPRNIGFATASSDDTPSLDAGNHDLLLPYSAAFLARLPEVRHALALPHGPADEILATLEHANEPIRSVYLAVPTQPWTVRRLQGPFRRSDALTAASEAVADYNSPSLAEWREWLTPGLCGALRSYTAAPWQANESSSRSSSAIRAGQLPRGVCAAPG
jgi:hypothetical protein